MIRGRWDGTTGDREEKPTSSQRHPQLDRAALDGSYSHADQQGRRHLDDRRRTGRPEKRAEKSPLQQYPHIIYSERLRGGQGTEP